RSLMSILKRKRNIVLAGLAAVGILAAGSIAYAAFTATSAANAAGTSATMQALTGGTTQVEFAHDETGLWPNVGDNHRAIVHVSVANPNEVAATVTAASITGAATFNNNTVQAACGSKLHLTPLVLANDPVVIPHNGT